MNATTLAESGIIPLWLIRIGIRQKLKHKLRIEHQKGSEAKAMLVQHLRESPIAIATDEANDQHYQVPTEFYQLILGPRMKYSGCYWPEGVTTLEKAELASLQLVAERAELEDGQTILEMGCGWGSFSLWAAERFPKSNILAVSNSQTQAAYIRSRANERGLSNLEVLTENIVTFKPKSQFDRIVSIEMLEHMRNYEALFQRMAKWLKDDGKAFVHVFSHRELAYTYEASDPNDWMSNSFFTGGTMPSHDLFSHFSEHLLIEQDWKLNGKHYTQTLEAWLERLNGNVESISEIFREHYGEVTRWLMRWRMFLLACSELFAYGDGREWGISHYRFVKRRN